MITDGARNDANRWLYTALERSMKEKQRIAQRKALTFGYIEPFVSV